MSFLLVARTAMSSSRRAALSVAAGMGFGAFVFAAIALAGLHTLLTLIPSLYTGLKVAGGCYLLWLALKMFRRPSNRSNDFTDAAEVSASKAFMTGVFTQISNPHTALVFASIFFLQRLAKIFRLLCTSSCQQWHSLLMCSGMPSLHAYYQLTGHAWLTLNTVSL